MEVRRHPHRGWRLTEVVRPASQDTVQPVSHLSPRSLVAKYPHLVKCIDVTRSDLALHVGKRRRRLGRAPGDALRERHEGGVRQSVGSGTSSQRLHIHRRSCPPRSKARKRTELLTLAEIGAFNSLYSLGDLCAAGQLSNHAQSLHRQRHCYAGSFRAQALVQESFLLIEGRLRNQDGATSVKAERIFPLAGAKPGVPSHDFH